MPERLHGRIGGHLRRHSIAYAALTVAFAFSPVPSMAADLVETGDIVDGAVTSAKIADETITTNDIRDGRVTPADLSASAKAAKVIRYDLGSFDFSVGNHIFARTLPGTWDAARVEGSTWSAVMYHSQSAWYQVVPGDGGWGQTSYRLQVTAAGNVFILPTDTGPGEFYGKIYLFRTIATSTVDVPQP